MTVSGVRNTVNIAQERRVIDMADKIALLDPQIGPFITVMKKVRKDTRVAHSPKIEWLEDKLLANTSTVDSVGGDTLTVADGGI